MNTQLEAGVDENVDNQQQRIHLRGESRGMLNRICRVSLVGWMISRRIAPMKLANVWMRPEAAVLFIVRGRLAQTGTDRLVLQTVWNKQQL